jgi:hypothetical protein
MKWSFVIQQKLKAALLLAGVMLLIIIGNVMFKFHFERIDRSFSSIYKDRLIPATTIIYLTEDLYRKRLSVEKFIYSKSLNSFDNLTAELVNYDNHIDSLIDSFEKTYLVDQEAVRLKAFKQRATEYIQLEKKILANYQSGNYEAGISLFEGEGADLFQRTILQLHELTLIQSNVGSQLMKDTKSDLAGFTLVSLIQIGLAVAIGLVLLGLIQNSKIMQMPQKKGLGKGDFNLN